jgi:hypothetical protein
VVGIFLPPAKTDKKIIPNGLGVSLGDGLGVSLGDGLDGGLAVALAVRSVRSRGGHEAEMLLCSPARLQAP